ncbi:hypothetical protein [Paraburkholderia sediminicola]|uniref:hypothetical protein n=1 Tax=Paraburkholderia sediminicola TaxID=458836 RepID=UPI0038B9B12A
MALTAGQMALLGGANGALGAYAGSQGGGSAGGGLMAGGMSNLAYSNPYSAAAMAAGQAFSSMMGGSDPSNSSGVSGYKNSVQSNLDGSGWTVSTGSSKASSTPTAASATQAVAQTAVAAMQNPMLLLAAVAVVMVWRKH